MPVFGKERKGRERTNLLEKEIIRPCEEKRKYKKRCWYIHTRGSAKRLKSCFPLLFKGKDFIQERFDKNGRPVIVLDWGCGRGNAIAGFAKEYGSKIKAYGFSKDSYKEWQKIDAVKLIHSTDKDLLRYLKNDSVDLIYSRFGLYLLFLSSSLLSSSKHKNTNKYIKELLKKVKKGGKIAFNIPLGEIVKPSLQKLLEGKADFEYNKQVIYITKK